MGLIKRSAASWLSSVAIEFHGKIGEFCLSSGGCVGKPSDQPPQPTNGSSGR
jgi:hypothetical protein